ncbi:MAG: aminotransferase class V-fold PLP-dependent enzyme [Cyclobacteriaceae bacterium]|jgi:alanine-glyoxylate transaminase/serine-glyoxylate transaminase/serine-pyruvate transaminase
MPNKSIPNRGWHFLQIPGPSNTPERVLRAMGQPTLDHRGPEFGVLSKRILGGLKKIFQTDDHVIVYPSSGTGAWEAALVNLFSPGDKVLAYETGYFAVLWKTLAEKIGLEVEWIESDWRQGVNAQAIEDRLKKDSRKKIKGIMIVHNETSSGITSNVKAVRDAIDNVHHPALLLVDVVSSLGTTPFYQKDWGVDVAICASQKGLMMPPGLGFNSINEKAREQAKQINKHQSYWQWEKIIEMNDTGYFPYTPASGLFYGLDESLNMIFEEGLDSLTERHRRLASACRVACEAWGLENQCLNPKEYSDSTTALIIPQGHNADDLRATILKEYNMSLGSGLGKLKSKVFRIGHLGDFNELMLMATLSGVEMGMELAKIPFQKGGVQAAIKYITDHNR